jgi:hypothetical protein
VQRKIDELETKWFSTHCFLKYYAKNANDKEKTVLGLTSLDKIDKNELVAVYSTSDIKPESHYLRHSENPTCYLDGNEVFTINKVEPFTELTLKF